MFRYNENQFKMTPPANIVYEGFLRKFTDLTREEWDELGWNEAIPMKREPFVDYETEWTKGDDLICREKELSRTENEQAKAAHEAELVRTERDLRLKATDWTQLKDTALDANEMVLWQSYRQALRDVPQQAGFPATIDWPEQPEKE